MSNIFIYISTSRMIPVDIDNFVVTGIGSSGRVRIRINGKFNKIPKEIGNCTSLEYIEIGHRGIIDISALSNCSSLITLYLPFNKIVNISPLYNCSSLVNLSLFSNKIVDMSPLTNCSSLKYLDIRYNNLCKFSKFNNNIKIYY